MLLALSACLRGDVGVRNHSGHGRLRPNRDGGRLRCGACPLHPRSESTSARFV
jgi:hypothetical protein